MTFDNAKMIISLRLKLLVATIIFLAYILLAYPARVIMFPLLGISETVWTIVLTALYLFVVFQPILLNYQYIYFSDDGENIIMRFFPAGVFGKKKNSVEISKQTFMGYHIDKKALGLIQSITLYQKLKQGRAKYPPVFISALKKGEMQKIIKALNNYCQGPINDE
jgi:hypothetical protein